MGCLTSKSFTANEKIPGQGYAVFKLAKVLGLSHEDVDAIYRAFCRFDIDRGGDSRISISEFIVVGGLEQSEVFGQMAFRLWDSDCSGHLDFSEFLCSVWAIASSDYLGLAAFTHMLFDFDNSGSLDSEELAFIGNLVWQFRPSQGAQHAISHLDEDGDGNITAAEFGKMIKNARIILQPAFEVMHFLQKCTMGSAAWDRVSQWRAKTYGGKSVFEILEISRSETQVMKSGPLDIARGAADGHPRPHGIDSKLNLAHKMFEGKKSALAHFKEEAIRLQNEGKQVAFAHDGRGVLGQVHSGSMMPRIVSSDNAKAIKAGQVVGSIDWREKDKPLPELHKNLYNHSSAVLAVRELVSGSAHVYSEDFHNQQHAKDSHGHGGHGHGGHSHSSPNSGSSHNRRPSVDAAAGTQASPGHSPPSRAAGEHGAAAADQHHHGGGGGGGGGGKSRRPSQDHGQGYDLHAPHHKHGHEPHANEVHEHAAKHGGHADLHTSSHSTHGSSHNDLHTSSHSHASGHHGKEQHHTSTHGH